MSDETATEIEIKKTAPEILRTILQDGVDFEVTNHRKKPRKFMIYPINLGTLFNISKIILTMKDIESLDGDDLFVVGVKNISDNKDAMLEITALAIMNRRIVTPLGRLKKWRLKRYLDNNLSAGELLKLVALVIAQMDVQDFLASFVSVKRFNLTEAKKKMAS